MMICRALLWLSLMAGLLAIWTPHHAEWSFTAILLFFSAALRVAASK